MSIENPSRSERETKVQTPSEHETAQMAGFRDRNESAPKNRNKYIAYGVISAVAGGAVWGAYEMGKSDNNEVPTNTDPVAEGPANPGQGEQPNPVENPGGEDPANPNIIEGPSIDVETGDHTGKYEFNDENGQAAISVGGEVFESSTEIAEFAEMPTANYEALSEEELDQALAEDLAVRIEAWANSGQDLSIYSNFDEYMANQLEEHPGVTPQDDPYNDARSAFIDALVIGDETQAAPGSYHPETMLDIRNVAGELHELLGGPTANGSPNYFTVTVDEVLQTADADLAVEDQLPARADNPRFNVYMTAEDSVGNSYEVQMAPEFTKVVNEEGEEAYKIAAMNLVTPTGGQSVPYVITPKAAN